MQIRIRATGQVLLQHEWEKWVAQTYAKSLSGISEEAVNRFESDIVFEGPQATGGTVYQYSQQDGVEQIDGKWYTKYILGPVFTGETAAADEAEYKARKDAEQAANVRKSRTEMLKDCDWVVGLGYIPPSLARHHCAVWFPLDNHLAYTTLNRSNYD